MSAEQGVYAPLPQSLSDSESEEEVHNAISLRRHHLRKKLYPNMDGAHKIEKLSNGSELTMRNYHPLDEPEESLNGFRHLRREIDDIAMFNKTKKFEPMSPMRKFCFILSILVCVFTIVIFLWVLPCSDSATCPAILPTVTTLNWLKSYRDLELKGIINVVDGLPRHSKSLIFLYRGDIINLGGHSEHYNRGGVISLGASSGEVVWYHETFKIPTDIDCSLIDVDKNGAPDCLVVGSDGQLECLNPVSGVVYWSLDSNNCVINSLNFPLILPDLNMDGVNELLSSCSRNRTELDSLIIISGSNGIVIGQPFKVDKCTAIDNLSISSQGVVFTCRSNMSDIPYKLPFNTLFKKITNKTLKAKIDFSKIEKQHKRISVQTNTEQSQVYAVNDCEIIVENHGLCPDCSVSVKLIDKRKGISEITWDYHSTRSYAMVPAKLSFHGNANSSISGFVLKFWQWSGGARNLKRSTSMNGHRPDVFSAFKEKNPWSFPRFISRRNALPWPANQHNVSLHNITERVVLITFNATDMHIVNVSHSEMVQLCMMQSEDIVCQPDLNYQENSLMIADFDKDGSQELVSYLSSFEDVLGGDQSHNDWQLTTTVRVIRLEAEIPKLYEYVTKN